MPLFKVPLMLCCCPTDHLRLSHLFLYPLSCGNCLGCPIALEGTTNRFICFCSFCTVNVIIHQHVVKSILFCQRLFVYLSYLKKSSHYPIIDGVTVNLNLEEGINRTLGTVHFMDDKDTEDQTKHQKCLIQEQINKDRGD